MSYGGILELRREFPASSCVGPGKPNFPFYLRGKAGGCARVTAGQKRPHLGVCPGHNIPLKGRQGSRGCILDSPVESGLVSRAPANSCLAPTNQPKVTSQNLQCSAAPSSMILLKIPFWSLQKPVLSLAPFLHPLLCQSTLGQRHLGHSGEQGVGHKHSRSPHYQHPIARPTSQTLRKHTAEQ